MRFPVQERVEAGVSYRKTMLAEFGWGGAYIVSLLILMGVSQVLTVFDYQPIQNEATPCGSRSSAAAALRHSGFARLAGRCSSF